MNQTKITLLKTIKYLTNIFLVFAYFISLACLPFYSLPTKAAATTDSLIGYWKFDETSGTTPADASGDGNTGTFVSSPTISTTYAPTNFSNTRGLQFDSTNDAVSVTSTAALQAWTTGYTYSIWFKRDEIGTSEHGLITYGSTNNQGVALVINANKIYFWLPSYSILQSATSVNNTNWHHVAGVFDNVNNSLKIYLDGSLDNSATETNDPVTPTTNLIIGNTPNVTTRAFSGYLDEARIYSRALSATEVAALAAGNHTSASWSGGTSTNYETAANWDISAIPDPYTLVTVANSGASPIFTANTQLARLTINSSAELNLSSFNLTLNDSGSFANNGTLILNGSQTLTNFTNDSDTGTEIIRGTSNLTGFPTGTSYNNLRVEDPTETDLVAYWKLDEGGGTSAFDLSGNSYTGTLTNGPTYSTNLPSTISFSNARSLSFDGTDDYISISRPVSDDFTISAWVNKSASLLNNGACADDQFYCGYGIVDGETPTVTNDFALGIKDNKVIFGTGNPDTNVLTTTTLTTGQWYHVAATRVKSTGAIKIYLNGIEEDNDTGGTNSLTAPTDLTIGVSSPTVLRGYFNGLIDDVRLYDTALSPTEISNLANGRYATGNSGTATHTLNANLTVNGSLSLDSGNLSTNTFTNTVTNLCTLASGNGTYTAGSGTQTFNGGLTISGGTYTGGTGTTDINGALTISEGALTASSNNLNISGNFAHSGGTFTHNSGTVILDGTDQTISGSTTFNNLTKSTGGTTLTFPASATQTISGILTLQGENGSLLSLRSSSTGTQWAINPQGAKEISYVDVKDSNNTGGTIYLAADIWTNSGNNINWSLPSATSTSCTYTQCGPLCCIKGCCQYKDSICSDDVLCSSSSSSSSSGAITNTLSSSSSSSGDSNSISQSSSSSGQTDSNLPSSNAEPSQLEGIPDISSEPIPVEEFVNGTMTSDSNNSKLIAGSENAIYLTNLTNEIKEMLADTNGQKLSIQIIDVLGQAHIIGATIFFPENSSSPLLITEAIPETLLDSSLINLVVILGNKPIAQTIVSVVKPRIEDETSSESLNQFVPIIEEVIVVRGKKSLRVKVEGINFLKNLKHKKKKIEQTVFEIIPGNNLIFKKKVIKGQGTKAKAYFKILDKNIRGGFVFVITNPYGRAVKKVEVPQKS